MVKKFWVQVLLFLVIALAIEATFVIVQWNVVPWSQAAADAGQALTGIVALLVLVSFISERTRNLTDSALDAVRMFVSEVMPINLRLDEIKREQYGGITFKLPRIENVEEFSISWMKQNKLSDAMPHVEFQREDSNQPYLLEIRNLLNQYEYLSLFIKQRGLESHESVQILKDAFVADIEQHSFLISTNRLVVSGLYPNLIWLYGKWHKSVDRMAIEEKMKLMS